MEVTTGSKSLPSNQTPLSEKEILLAALSEEYKNCHACGLHKKCKQKVFGAGNINSKIMFIGMGPGEDEDEQGLPFVGRSGQLLQDILQHIGIPYNAVYRTNLVLCRPFEMVDKKAVNRDPSKPEVHACAERLRQEIYIVDPTVIVLLGVSPFKYLAGKNLAMINARGQLFTIRLQGKERIIEYPAIATWHPSYLLRQGSPVEGDPRDQAIQDITKAIRMAKRLSKEYEKE